MAWRQNASTDSSPAGGVLVGLKDRFHRPRQPQIRAKAKAWVVSLACTKPKDHVQRVEEERGGLVRWLRPEFQSPEQAPVQTAIEEGAISVPASTWISSTTKAKQPWPTSLRSTPLATRPEDD